MMDQGNLRHLNHLEEANSENFVMGGDAAEFVNKVKDPSARKTEKNVERCRFWRGTFNNLVNVHGCDDECGDIHGKEISWIMKIPQISPLKNMFDISEKLVSEQEEINNFRQTCLGKFIHGNSCHGLVMKTVINLQRTKVYVFSDSVLCLGKVHQHPDSKEAWKNRIAGVKIREKLQIL